MTISNWYILDDFLFEKDTKNKLEKFTTYLSPYLIPKAFRCKHDSNDSVVIEFKYIDVNEKIIKTAHPETHRIHFEIGDKTGRIYRVFLHSMKSTDSKSIDNHKLEIKRAFDNIAIKNGVHAKEKYQATLAATNKCLSNMKKLVIAEY
ncbi:hypothetical protein D3C85_574780 [compost metagenome]